MFSLRGPHKFDEISKLIWIFLYSERQIKWGISLNLCGLQRKSEFRYIHRMPTIWELRNMLHFSCVQRAGPFNHNLHHISMSKWSDALQMGWKISVICHNESRHVAKLPRFSYIYFSGQKKVNQFGKCLGSFLKHEFMQRI